MLQYNTISYLHISNNVISIINRTYCKRCNLCKLLRFPRCLYSPVFRDPTLIISLLRCFFRPRCNLELPSKISFRHNSRSLGNPRNNSILGRWLNIKNYISLGYYILIISIIFVIQFAKIVFVI